jgi:hypothetical protein
MPAVVGTIGLHKDTNDASKFGISTVYETADESIIPLLKNQNNVLAKLSF